MNLQYAESVKRRFGCIGIWIGRVGKEGRRLWICVHHVSLNKNMKHWKLGDIVRHKTGKRKMQVVCVMGGPSSVLGGYLYDCKWETPDGFNRGSFEGWELEKYKK